MYKKYNEMKEILKHGEGTLIEFKSSVSSSLVRELSAFSNTAGGRIFIGINDNNVVIGCKLNNKLKSKIQSMANNCDPKVLLDIDSMKYQESEIIIVKVYESKDKPVQCSDGFFLREGANTQKMTRKEIFYWVQATRKIRFENQPRPDFKYPDDFNQKGFIEIMKRMNITITDEKEDILYNIGLGELGKSFTINNAGILMFGNRRDLYIRQVYVTCVLYKGNDKVKILDRKDFRDGLLQDYENAYKFLQQHLKLEYIIEGGGPRKEIPEIPYEALKEALLNSIIHRDYFEEGARVMVEIFDDRVEISNPGELLFDKKEFGKKSVARNPVIFDMFSRLQLIEKVGSGIKRIMTAVSEQNIKVDFETGTFFTAIFFRPERKNEPVDHPSTAQVPRKYHASTEQVPSKYHTGTTPVPHQYHTSTAQARKVVGFCRVPRRRNEIQEHLQLKNKWHFRKEILKPLIDAGYINYTIPDKKNSPKQKYIITKKGKELLKNKNKQF